jgi:hypothetical protein
MWARIGHFAERAVLIGAYACLILTVAILAGWGINGIPQTCMKYPETCALAVKAGDWVMWAGAAILVLMLGLMLRVRR